MLILCNATNERVAVTAQACSSQSCSAEVLRLLAIGLTLVGIGDVALLARLRLAPGARHLGGAELVLRRLRALQGQGHGRGEIRVEISTRIVLAASWARGNRKQTGDTAVPAMTSAADAPR